MGGCNAYSVLSLKRNVIYACMSPSQRASASLPTRAGRTELPLMQEEGRIVSYVQSSYMYQRKSKSTIPCRRTSGAHTTPCDFKTPYARIQSNLFNEHLPSLRSTMLDERL